MKMMIDYRKNDGEIARKVIDDFEFCVRRGEVFFISEGIRYSLPLENVIQVYMN